MTVFRSRLIRIGDSYGIIVPKAVLKEEKMKAGERIDVALLKRKKIALIEEAFGSAKGARSFRRGYEPERV